MFELILTCPEDHVELLSDALEALDALSVAVEDADAGTPEERALFGEPGLPPPSEAWQRSRIASLFAERQQAEHAAAVLRAQDFFAACEIVGVRAIADQDWVRLTQSQFEPVSITDRFWIVPTWHEVPPQAQRAIRLDPGLAFGTGTHPTTRMCLRWIAAHEGELGRVIDYGCGSGILAIAAAMHGATRVEAVDIDPAAIEATRFNAESNRVELIAGAPEAASGPYETVVANILATPLKVLAPLLSRLVAPGGNLVLSGILQRQADELKDAYAPYLSLHVADEEDGWILMTARA
jgi:ribosomal protein L11 methyltransferase